MTTKEEIRIAPAVMGALFIPLMMGLQSGNLDNKQSLYLIATYSIACVLVYLKGVITR